VRAKLLVVSLAGAGALAASLGSVAVGDAAAVKHVRCIETQVPLNKSGSEQLGASRCGAPLGAGVLQSSTAGSVSGNVITLAGSYKYYFNLGTIHGTYRLAGSTRSSKLTGTARVSGGTGAYRRAAGVASISCFSPRNRATTRCTMKFTLTRI
jgi:hypothetical protein